MGHAGISKAAAASRSSTLELSEADHRWSQMITNDHSKSHHIITALITSPFGPFGPYRTLSDPIGPFASTVKRLGRRRLPMPCGVHCVHCVHWSSRDFVGEVRRFDFRRHAAGRSRSDAPGQMSNIYKTSLISWFQHLSIPFNNVCNAMVWWHTA